LDIRLPLVGSQCQCWYFAISYKFQNWYIGSLSIDKLIWWWGQSNIKYLGIISWLRMDYELTDLVKGCTLLDVMVFWRDVPNGFNGLDKKWCIHFCQPTKLGKIWQNVAKLGLATLVCTMVTYQDNDHFDIS
jgi:hypothetical protein